jgi:asparagine synthase (glutamine-hydrolysing)
MCGIFGIIDHRGREAPPRERLERTAQRMRHRGPDAWGVHQTPSAGFAHTRLSLLDPDPRSGQPFWDENDRYCLVYNGEIYNFQRLRAELQRAGCCFRTTSDTEVLLAAILTWGVHNTVMKLEGMFAFACYDTLARTLVLARDRFGIKPLYVYDHPDRFLFSSAVRPLRQWLDLKPDLFTISSYLQGYSGPAAGFTFYQDVKSLPPATMVTVPAGGPAKYEVYFDVSELPDRAYHEQLASRSSRQLIDQLETALRDSVKSQLIADAPVGALCSGGIDSSLIVAIAATMRPDLTVFHANVVGKTSEQHAALALAKHLGLNLRVVNVEDHHFIEGLPEVMAHYEQPFTFHPESIAYLMVSRMVHAHGHKAVLSGEGADELFLGYHQSVPKLGEWLWRRYFRAIGRTFRISTQNHTPHSASRGGFGISASDGHLVRGLHNRFERDQEIARIRSYCAHTMGLPDGEREWSTLHQLTYGLRTLLHRNDTLGMAASVETRFPYLDASLVHFAVNLPARYKVCPAAAVCDRKHPFVRDKWILRKVADRYLPFSLSRRAKQGFPTDAFARMRIMPQVLEHSFVAELFGLTPANVNFLMQRAGHGLKLRLLHLDVWGHVCLRGISPDAVADRLKSRLRIAA